MGFSDNMLREYNPLVIGRVVGDVLNPFTKSVDRLDVCYNSIKVGNGREFKPSQVVRRPNVIVGGDDLRTFYTLLMVDPDSPNPSNPYNREYLHWLITDIPATTGPAFGKELIPYERPTPTIGIHRFVFALFQQLGRDTVYAPDWRQNFNTREFAEIYHLGSSIDAVFFNCQRETGSGGRKIC